MTKSLFYILVIALGVALASCSDKYLVHTGHYGFKSESGLPDYTDINYWAAHPWKKDPSDSLPGALQKEKRDSVVDVFFLHPTTYVDAVWIDEKNLSDSTERTRWNAPIDDSFINEKTDATSILFQASAFNRYRVFAPRYRHPDYVGCNHPWKEGG